jgi:hypothetical protein
VRRKRKKEKRLLEMYSIIVKRGKNNGKRGARDEHVGVPVPQYGDE